MTTRQLSIRRNGPIHRLINITPATLAIWAWNGKLELVEQRDQPACVSLCALFWACVFMLTFAVALNVAVFAVSLVVVPVFILTRDLVKAAIWGVKALVSAILPDSLEQRMEGLGDARVVVAMLRMKRTLCPLVEIQDERPTVDARRA